MTPTTMTMARLEEDGDRRLEEKTEIANKQRGGDEANGKEVEMKKLINHFK